MKRTEQIETTLGTTLNQVLDLLKSSLDSCQQHLLNINDRNQCDTFDEAIQDKKHMIQEWEDQMKINGIKIDKRTDTTVKDTYPDRLDEVTKGGSPEIFEKELIEMRAALANRDDLPVGFKKILASQRSYIF